MVVGSTQQGVLKSVLAETCLQIPTALSYVLLPACLLWESSVNHQIVAKLANGYAGIDY